MKPAPFEYYRPATVAEALSILDRYSNEDRHVKLLAGGQSLIPLMNLRMATPEVLIDVTGIGTMRDIYSGPNGLEIGACATQRELELSTTVKHKVPIISAALPYVAHVPIRERGTLGGSLIHADPSAELPVAAVLSGARASLSSPNGSRTIPVTDLIVGPLASDAGPEEILVSTTWPVSCERAGWGFEEFAQRPGDFAWALTAATVCTDDSTRISNAAFAVGGVISPPMRLELNEILGELPDGTKILRLIEEFARAQLEQLDLLESDSIKPEDLLALTTHLTVEAFRVALKEALSKQEGAQCTCQ